MSSNQMTNRSWRPGFPLALAIVAVAVYSAAAVLAILAYRYEAFRPAMDRLGIRFWNQPFLDLKGVLSWSECHRLGYDVMRVNPCDPLGRLLNYSPLTRYLPFGTEATIAGGLAIDGAFLLILPLIVRPRSRSELGLVLAAVLCPFSVGFALERANLDLAIFVIAATGIWLTARTGLLRYAGYFLYLVIGLLKFYPLILLGTLARERSRTALIAGLLLALIVALLVFAFWSDLVRIPALLPKAEFTKDNFGAVILSLATMHFFGWPEANAGAMQLILSASAATAAVPLSVRIRPLIAESRLGTYPLAFLIAGALLIVGAFFAQTNIAYRAVFLLFLMPGLFRLREMPEKEGRIFSLCLTAMFLCLWEAIFRLPLNLASGALAQSGIAGVVMNTLAGMFFLLREAAWWWNVTVLLAVLIVFFSQTKAVREGLALTRWRPRQTGVP